MSESSIQNRARLNALELYRRAGIVLNEQEKKHLEFCDYGLEDFDRIGTEILIYVNTKRVCAKEMALMPNQICPEHIHPPLGDYPGKEETFRCRWGEVFLYVPGEPTPHPHATVPEERKQWFTVWHEIHLLPGEQYTLREQTLHWFQAGPDGAVISEFSTPSFDNSDIFTDPQIQRIGKFD